MAGSSLDNITISWIDRLMRPELGASTIILRSVLFGLAVFSFGTLPLTLTGNSDLILHPIILYSSIGVVWVSCFSFLLNIQRNILKDAVISFKWENIASRNSFLEHYLSYVNADIRSITYGFIASLFVIVYIIISISYPEVLANLSMNIFEGQKPTNGQVLPFIISAGCIIFVGGIIAFTGGRVIRGSVEYTENLDPANFDTSLTRLRQHLTRQINWTGWSGLSYSTGIAVILFALKLDFQNLVVLFSVSVVFFIVIYAYLSVWIKSNRIYDKAVERVEEQIGTMLLPEHNRLINELAHEALGRLSRPLLNLAKAMRTVLTIVAPIVLVIFDDSIRVTWWGLMNIVQ